ncbi:uncharacterized protein [Watersipora subatra]|uniref:uncharacterized protein n=1 Tax=Watersipora subatra TaxID=2589382 RepID=UPI00355B0D9B
MNLMGRRFLTSLLQQAAVSYSVECMQTTFIRPEPLTQLPYSVHGMYQMSYATVQNIRYLYMNSAEKLITYLCGINNSLSQVPQVIIIDGLDFYAQQLQCSSETAICKLSSCLKDTLRYLNERLSVTTPLLVSVGDTLHNHLVIYGRDFDVYSLRQGGSPSHPISYALEKLAISAEDEIIRYNLTLTDAICLKSIECLHSDAVPVNDR